MRTPTWLLLLEVACWLATLVAAANGYYRAAMAFGSTGVALALGELAVKLRAIRRRGE